MRRFHHICIQTDKYKESVLFYKNILGFKLISESENFHTRAYNAWLEQNGMMIELQTAKENENLIAFSKNSLGIVHFCLVVDDINVEYQRIKKLNFNNFKYKKGQDIYEVEGGKLFKIIAPEGTIIEIRDQTEI